MGAAECRQLPFVLLGNMDERKALCEDVILQFRPLIAAQAEHIIGQKLHLVGVHSVFVNSDFIKSLLVLVLPL